MGQAWDAVAELMAGVSALGVPPPIRAAIEQLIRHHCEDGKLTVPIAPPPAPVDIGRMARLMHKRAIARTDLLGDLLADGAWHMLLELTAEDARGKGVSVSSLCIASGVPPTTALRYLKAMEERGLIQRYPDRRDGRRTWVHMTDMTRDAMHRAVREYAEDVSSRRRIAVSTTMPELRAMAR